MITIKPMAVFEDLVRKRQGRGRNDRVIIDLFDSASKEEVVQRIGNRLRGHQSPHIEGFSLDALIDVVSAWMADQANDIPRVTIINAGVAALVEIDLLPRIVAAMHVFYLHTAVMLSKKNPDFMLSHDIYRKINIELFV